jgi:hypothetical protein
MYCSDAGRTGLLRGLARLPIFAARQNSARSGAGLSRMNARKGERESSRVSVQMLNGRIGC